MATSRSFIAARPTAALWDHPTVRKVGDIAFFAFLQFSAVARFVAGGEALHDGEVLRAGAQASTGAMLAAMAILFLLRRPVVGQRASWSEITVAMIGSWSVVPLGWLPLTWTSDGVLAFSLVANTLGAIGVCYALRNLGRSFAVLPEARALVTSGPYRWVRHPIYTLHILTLFGTMLPRVGLLAVAILILGIGGEVLRARNEERALRRVFPEYAAYQTRTKRFIPFVY